VAANPLAPYIEPPFHLAIDIVILTLSGFQTLTGLKRLNKQTTTP